MFSTWARVQAAGSMIAARDHLSHPHLGHSLIALFEVMHSEPRW